MAKKCRNSFSILPPEIFPPLRNLKLPSDIQNAPFTLFLSFRHNFKKSKKKQGGVGQKENPTDVNENFEIKTHASVFGGARLGKAFE